MLLLFIFILPVSAETYSFEFDEGSGAESLYDDYVGSLPHDVKEKLHDDTSEYDFGYFADEIVSAVKESVGKAMGMLSKLAGTVVLASAVNIMSKHFEGHRSRAFSFCSSLCVVLLIWDVFVSVSDMAKVLLETLSNAMLMISPVMEGMLIYSGNITAASVSGAGVGVMITLGENLFSKVLFPCAVICFFLSSASAIAENSGISYMSKLLKGLVTGGLIASMALMSFVIAIQNTAATAADSLAAKTLKFAISSYLPIVGGTVADSFSCLAASVQVIKQLCGVTGIVVLVIVLIPPFVMLLADRIAIGVAGALAGMLECEREKTVLDEAGSICTVMIAVCAGASVMYMIALGIFCRTAVAIS